MVSALVSVLAAPTAADAAADGAFELTSQLVDRGLAITPPTPVLQGAVSWNSSAGWSIGLAAAAETRSGRVAEGLARLSDTWALADDWQMQTSLQYYHYDSLTRLNAYEAGLAWTYRDLLTFGVAGIYAPATRHRLRPALDLNFHWPLAQHFFLSAGLGYTRYVIPIHANHCDYEVAEFYPYAQAGLTWNNGPWRIELDRVLLRGEVRRHLDRLAPSPWLAAVSWSF
jgi:hypothetical protein